MLHRIQPNIVEAVQTATPPAGRNRFLAMLPPADLATLAPHLKDCVLERRQTLHEQGEPYEFVYFPYSGMISLLTVTGRGETVEAALIGHESGVGLTSGLGSPVAVNRAIVQLPGAAARIPVSRFAAAVEQSAILRSLVVRHSEMVLAQAQQAAACNILHDVESRLCKWLLQARDRTGSDTLPLTHEFLSQMLGVRRSTVTLVARLLQGSGMINYRRGQITIRDPHALAQTSCECGRMLRQQSQRLLDNA